MIVGLLRFIRIGFWGIMVASLAPLLCAAEPPLLPPDLAADTPLIRSYLKDARFAEAWNAYTNRQFERAYDLFSAMLRSRPGEDGVDFAYALAARQCGKLSHATLAYERILQRNPRNPRVSLELGRLYLEMKQPGLAREHLLAAWNSKPPPEVKSQIRRYLEVIEPRATSRFQGSGRIGVGALYDNNVNIGPDASTIAIAPIDTGGIPLDTLTVDESSRPLSAAGLFALAGASGSWDLGDPRGWSLIGGLDYYGNWMEDASEYDLAIGDANLGWRYAHPRHLVHLPVQGRHISRGDSTLANLLGTAPFWIWAPTPTWQSIAGVGIEARNYVDLDERDSTLYTISESVRRFFGKPRHAVSAGVTLYAEDAEADIYDQTGWSGSAALELRPTPAALLYGRGTYRESRYAERETLAPEKRDDQQWQALLGLRHALPAGWALDASWQWTDNQSTFDLYDYRRQIFTISTTWTF